jgi:hypothetical protein
MGPGMPVDQSHNPVVVFSTQISLASDIQSHKNVNRFLIVPSSNCKMTYATDPSIGITTYGRPTGYSRRMRSTGFCLALGRFTFGVGLAPRWRPRPEPGRSVCDFLSAWRFAPKAPLLIVGFLWISLDFSRPNRDLSMGYAAWSRETFFSALFPGVRSAGTGAWWSRPCGSAGMLMRQA